MLFNYHTHTTRCNHALGSDREYVEAAIAAGCCQLGFSDHSPYIFPESYGDYYSGFRMRPEAFSEYAESVFSLRDEYRDRIGIFLGVEIEYYPAGFDRTEKFLKDGGVEYMILGQHFSGNECDPGAVYVPAPHADEELVLAKYVDLVGKAIESGKFLYVAHPDLVLFNGDAGLYRKHMSRICEASLRHNVPLEINLGGCRARKHYPAREFWKLAGEVGAPAVFGVDAHTPADLAGWAAAVEEFKKTNADLGLNYVEEPLL